MEMKQLTYFITIAQEHSVSAAAKKLEITYHSMNYQLKLLEEELGIKLFERCSRQMHLTNAGQLLFKRAQEILQAIKDTGRELHNCNSKLEGLLTIGTESAYGAFILTKYINKFRQKNPDVRFEIKEGTREGLLTMLHEHQTDMIFTLTTPPPIEGIEHIYCTKEPMVAAGWTEFFDMNTPVVDVEQLRNRPLIVKRDMEQPISAACGKSGFYPHIICKSEDDRTSLLWAVAGMGIALVAQSALRIVRDVNLDCRAIKSDDLGYQLAAVWNTQEPLSTVAEEFISIVRLI